MDVRKLHDNNTNDNDDESTVVASNSTHATALECPDLPESFKELVDGDEVLHSSILICMAGFSDRRLTTEEYKQLCKLMQLLLEGALVRIKNLSDEKIRIIRDILELGDTGKDKDMVNIIRATVQDTVGHDSNEAFFVNYDENARNRNVDEYNDDDNDFAEVSTDDDYEEVSDVVSSRTYDIVRPKPIILPDHVRQEIENSDMVEV